MKYPPKRVIYQYLLNQAYFTPYVESGWNAAVFAGFCGRTPKAPDRLVAVHGTEGVVADRLLTGYTYQFFGVQIQTRGEKELGGDDFAYDKIKTIVDDLVHIRDAAIALPSASYKIHQVMLDSGPLDVGREEQTERPMYTANLLVHLTKT